MVDIAGGGCAALEGAAEGWRGGVPSRYDFLTCQSGRTNGRYKREYK